MRSCRARRVSLLLAALLLAPLPLAFGHGGTFRGPNGGVPPGLRAPSDPEPPPPPPSSGTGWRARVHSDFQSTGCLRRKLDLW